MAGTEKVSLIIGGKRYDVDFNHGEGWVELLSVSGGADGRTRQAIREELLEMMRVERSVV